MPPPPSLYHLPPRPRLALLIRAFHFRLLVNRQSDLCLYGFFFVPFAEHRDEKALDHSTIVVIDALIPSPPPPSHHPQSLSGLAPTYSFTRVFKQRLRLWMMCFKTFHVSRPYVYHVLFIIVSLYNASNIGSID